MRLYLVQHGQAFPAAEQADDPPGPGAAVAVASGMLGGMLVGDLAVNA
jgi:predicted lipid-binding transport protein (Tim44 family)